MGVRRDEPVAPDALGASALDPSCCSKPILANQLRSLHVIGLLLAMFGGSRCDRQKA